MLKLNKRLYFDKRLAGEEVWIRQGIKARRTRNEGRVRRLEHAVKSIGSGMRYKVKFKPKSAWKLPVK